MQKVVSNSSPIIHLAKIDKLYLLMEYFREIIIPDAVFQECIPDGKSHKEIELIKNTQWIKIEKVSNSNMVRLLLSDLDYGEANAITLANQISADLILLDDMEAREKARKIELKVTGTIGILLRAKLDGQIKSLKKNMIMLKESGFWIKDSLLQKLLAEANESL